MRQRLSDETFDVAIVGGGINGAVAAAALSAAGLKVALLDKGDFASSTSQESSNLVWGGIKYLESYEFGLVWDLCRSRNELMRSYPDEVQELRFFTHLERGFRKPRILVFLGSLLYWFMGRFFTRPPRLLSVAAIETEEPIIDTSRSQGGLEYSDCFLKDNDARFVFHFVRRAIRMGAAAFNYAEVKAMKRVKQSEGTAVWELEVQDKKKSSTLNVRARLLINAAGPYADRLNSIAGIKTRYRHIFSKGVHLIVPRLSQAERVLTFFADDGRMFFVIPMGACSCIGTTDTRVQELPARVESSDRLFILENINKRLRLARPLTEADIIAERCGVRPLVVQALDGDLDQEDWVNLSRKHEIEWDLQQGHISIFGGKLTDCLNIGRELLRCVEHLGLKPRDPGFWYGEGAPAAKAQYTAAARALGFDRIETSGEGTLLQRLWRNYGEDSLRIIDLVQRDPQLSERLLPQAPVIMAEAVFMAEEELVVDLEDFLRRRTRLALVVKREELAASGALFRACQLLFGSEAEQQWQVYFNSQIPA